LASAEITRRRATNVYSLLRKDAALENRPLPPAHDGRHQVEQDDKVPVRQIRLHVRQPAAVSVILADSMAATSADPLFYKKTAEEAMYSWIPRWIHIGTSGSTSFRTLWVHMICFGSLSHSDFRSSPKPLR